MSPSGPAGPPRAAVEFRAGVSARGLRPSGTRGRGPAGRRPEIETRGRSQQRRAARAETRPECHGARFLRPSHLPLATAARPRAVPRPRGMDPHVLAAGLYWLLLPCTLLAGEWRARAGRLRPRGCARASIGEEIPRDSRPRAPAFQRRERAGGLGGPGPGTEAAARRGSPGAPDSAGRLRAGWEERPQRGAVSV